jgi:hypothetical protein
LPCALLLIGSGMAAEAHSQGAMSHTTKSSAQGQLAEPLSIQINSDKLTLAVAKVPQVYLYGTIDADAPNRFAALVRSGKIPPESDVYLNSSGGDISAGQALGRLFRTGSMATHLGVPRRNSRTPAGPRNALCVGACTYAYAGGLFRWAPTGSDHFGVQALDGAHPNTSNGGKPSSEATTYLKEMGLDPSTLTPASTAPHDDVIWLTGDQMLETGLANNGRLAPTATYHLMSGAPYLTLGQTARDGEHRITLLCRPDGLMLTAYYMIGVDRARRVMARGTRSYFEVDHQQTLQEERDGSSTASQSVVITRQISLAQLAPLLSARSMGAWLSDRGGAVRYGFTIELDSVRNNLREYSANCEQMAKQSKVQKS